MWPLDRFKAWIAERRLQKELEQAKKDLEVLALEYKTFPRLTPLKTGAWAVMAPGYHPVIGNSPKEAIQKFRKRNRKRA